MKLTSRFLALILSFACLSSLLAACGTPTEPEVGKIPAARGLRLAYESKSPYRVVVSENASEDVRIMADEFLTYFEQITGAKIIIVNDSASNKSEETTINGVTYTSIPEIVIGNAERDICKKAKADELLEEEFLIYSDESDLLLTGGSDRAVAYAVYAFLEESVGVRYWTPEDEYVPSSPTLEVAPRMNRRSAPAFAFRTIEGAGASDPKWAVKMRFNSRQSLGSKNYKRDFFVGGGIGYADWYVHTITKLAEMPEKDENGNYNTAQPCLTDERVYQTVLKNVRKWLEQYPDADILSISQNDGGDESKMCACENCTKIYEAHGKVQSAKWVWFVSKIANELADEYPDVYFDTLAYSFTLLAPTNLSVPDNVIIRIAPIGTCYEHPYFTCAAEAGPARAQRITHRLQLALRDWNTIAENVYVWDYAALFANYWAPLGNFSTLKKNLALYQQYSVDGLYMQADAATPMAELTSYLLAKLLWEPSMSDEEYEQHAKEFCEYFYGSYEPIREYLDLVDTEAKKSHFSTHAVLCRDFLTPHVIEEEDGSIRWDKTLLTKMQDCFERAENVENLTDAQKLHLRKARVSVKYYELISLFYLEEHCDGFEVDLEYREELNREIFEDAKACGLSAVSESVNKLPEKPNFSFPPLKWNNRPDGDVEQY